ncbi:MAG: NAD-binding protein [Planctomycetota bacterium]
MRSRRRRILANLYFLARPFRQFLPLLGVLIAVLIIGMFSFRVLAPAECPSYPAALYMTFCLVFMEHAHGEFFPEHPWLQILYFGVPVLGLVVILDGIVRFGRVVLNRNETGREWVIAMSKTLEDHVILCGLGKVGLRVLEQLLRLNELVLVLEKDPLCPNLAYARNHGIPVRIGNGREEGIFEELNVVKAKSIILATDDDLANLEMSLDARRLHPSIRVVMRMFDQELADKVRQSFDIQLAFSTSELSAPLFATASSDRTIINAFRVDEELLVVAELEIGKDSQLIGKRLGDVGREQRAFVLMHRRNDERRYYPDADLIFAEGDAITVQTRPEALKRLHDLNGDTHRR